MVKCVLAEAIQNIIKIEKKSVGSSFVVKSDHIYSAVKSKMYVSFAARKNASLAAI